MTKVKVFEPTEEQANLLMSYDATDYGNAKSVELLFGDRVRFVSQWGLLVYNGKYWDRENAKHYLNTMVITTIKIRGKLAFDMQKEAIQKCCSTKNSCINGATEAFLRLESLIAQHTDFDKHIDLLNVNNGVINLRTGELLPHSHDYLFTSCSSVDYNLDADPSMIIKQLSETVLNYSDEKVAEFIQMALGYSVTGSTKEEKLFTLIGPTRSGKSLLLMLMQEVLGEKLAGATGFSTFTKDRGDKDQGFDIAPLHACRFVAATESKSDDVFNESAIKSYTGRDKISASFKGQDHFKFLPKWKIWLASNFKPKGDVNDNAFWNRLIMIVFPNSFEGKEDSTLKDRFCEKEPLEGFLLWVVQGAMKWYKLEHKLITPKVFVDALQEAKEELDSVGRWLADNCDLTDETALSPTTATYDNYEKWAREVDGSHPWKENAFKNYLQTKGFKITRGRFPTGKQITHKGKRIEEHKQLRAYAGLKFNEDTAFFV